jgi:geranylgeranyl diphosphate synthase type II
LIDLELRKRLKRVTEESPKRLMEAVEYSLLAPGKRLRPVLCLMACETAGGNLHQAIGNACALEMIHCYSLIHDDLPAMDDDDLRRGRPTCHRQFDEATAILAGDALQPLAFESILSASLGPSALVESCQVLAWASGIRGMVGGQMDDLLEENRSQMQSHLSEGVEEPPAKRLDSIHRRKTGAMIEASVVLGAIAAGATSECRSALAKYGRGIGIAFQIVDDLLDVESTSEKTGKATGKDAGRGKLTFPGIYGITQSREMASRWVAESLAALEPFTHQAEGLRQIAKYILERHS